MPVHYGHEVDAYCVGGGIVAAPVHYGEKVDASSGGDGVVAEKHYGEEANAYRGDIELNLCMI